MNPITFRSPDPNSQRHPPPSPLSNRSGAGPTPFRAPAHKHAHHLHSIPPREKSTRTLIIDHMLWVHSRTRFAQARAELGMTDKTGGLASSNYTHRERPENYEEEDEAYSDGEDVVTLLARSGGPGHQHEADEDERLEVQNLSLARNLRQRAESVEKVITAMLDQPPQVPPLHPDDLLDPPTTSPQFYTNPVQPRPHLHTLPNGVRLRLALGTVINDLFARKAPAHPQRPYVQQSGSSSPPTLSLPSALVPLASVSLVNAPRGTTRKPVPNDYIRTLYAIGADPETQNSPPSLRCPRHLHMGCEICVEAVAPRPGHKGRSSSGRTGSTPTGGSPGDGSALGYSGGNVFGLGGGVTGLQEGSGIGSGLARAGGKGSILRRPSVMHSESSSRGMGSSQEKSTQSMTNTKLAEFVIRFLRLSALVAMELGREATEEGTSVEGGRDDDQSSHQHQHQHQHQQPHSVPPTPRPPTFSPQNLFRDIRPPQPQRQSSDFNLYENALRPSRQWYFLLSGLLTRTVLEGYIAGGWLGIEPLEVLLTIGLGMSPLPEGVLAGRNVPTMNMNTNTNMPMPMPMPTPLASAKPKAADPFAEFDPDDLPELDDAIRILFPALREVNFMTGGSNPYRRKEGAELDYEIEMLERLGRFYEVPGSTPDIATHMEDLAWQYPAEAVERAACRFCEAVSRWRGKPELETYKKATWLTASHDPRNPLSSANGGSMSMSIDSLVHSNPASPNRPPPPVVPVTRMMTQGGGFGGMGMQPGGSSSSLASGLVNGGINGGSGETNGNSNTMLGKSRRPAIEKYFTIPPSVLLQGRKRRRSEVGPGAEEGPPQRRTNQNQIFS